MIGWIGSLAFGFCGLPQALKIYQEGHADGLDLGFLLLWTVGEVFSFYAVLRDAPIPYLIANYVLTGIFLTIMWRYKLWPRKRDFTNMTKKRSFKEIRQHANEIIRRPPTTEQLDDLRES